MKTQAMTNILLLILCVCILSLTVLAFFDYSRFFNYEHTVTYHYNRDHIRVHFLTDSSVLDVWMPCELLPDQYRDGDTDTFSDPVWHGNASYRNHLDDLTMPNGSTVYFTGWYIDRSCTTPYDMSTPVKTDIDLYAGWEIIDPIPLK